MNAFWLWERILKEFKLKNIAFFSMLMMISSIQLLSCFDENVNTGPVDPKYFSRQIAEIISPQKTRSAKIYEGGNSNDSSTQIIVGFGWPKENGGGGVFTAKGINLGIKVNWMDEKNLIVTYKSSLKVYPITRTEVQLFSEKVKIHYQILKD